MLDDAAKELAKGVTFASLTTLSPSGQPMTHLMWVDADDDHILINTEIHRRKYKNIQNDPRVSLVLFDPNDPYTYTEIRGRVVSEVRGDLARASIDELSQKYEGRPYSNPITSERVLLKIAPDRVRTH